MPPWLLAACLFLMRELATWRNARKRRERHAALCAARFQPASGQLSCWYVEAYEEAREPAYTCSLHLSDASCVTPCLTAPPGAQKIGS